MCTCTAIAAYLWGKKQKYPQMPEYLHQLHLEGNFPHCYGSQSAECQAQEQSTQHGHLRPWPKQHWQSCPAQGNKSVGAVQLLMLARKRGRNKNYQNQFCVTLCQGEERRQNLLQALWINMWQSWSSALAEHDWSTKGCLGCLELPGDITVGTQTAFTLQVSSGILIFMYSCPRMHDVQS